MENEMEHLLIIPGRLDGLNNYINAERSNRYAGAKMKAENEKITFYAIKNCLKNITIENPVFMEYSWIEKDKRRDLDNISSFGRKVIQDTLVKAGILKDDGWKNIIGFSDSFSVDSENPRIEVRIREVEK